MLSARRVEGLHHSCRIYSQYESLVHGFNLLALNQIRFTFLSYLCLVDLVCIGLIIPVGQSYNPLWAVTIATQLSIQSSVLVLLATMPLEMAWSLNICIDIIFLHDSRMTVASISSVLKINLKQTSGAFSRYSFLSADISSHLTGERERVTKVLL